MMLKHKIAAGLAAVSYTHLDVYKRQNQSCLMESQDHDNESHYSQKRFAADD